MIERLRFAPLRRWIRRYDRGFQNLVAQTEELNRRMMEAERQKAALETNLGQAAAREEGLKQQIALLQADLQRETWATNVLDDNFIAGRVAPSRKHAWLVAAPKSGSTWLTRMLIQLLGWQPHMLVPTWDRREQEIDVRRMLEFPNVDLFTIQQHCRYSGPTCDFIKNFRVQVILQGRNLWDSVVSLRDHFLQESTITPVCYADDTFRSQPLVRQLDWVIDLAVPWFLSFYASWFTGRQAGEVDFFWIDYESLCRDTAGQLRRIVQHLGLSRSDDEIEEAIQQTVGAPTRLNVGRAGRGAEMLTQGQKDRIAHLRAYYPHIDFSPVGLN